MLVITRKTNERVMVPMPGGELLEITVVRVDEGRVRLGFEGPVQILRREIWDEMRREETQRAVGSLTS